MVDHGGSLGRARALFPDAPEPWVDLSTGINPHSYPLFELPATALSRLPEASRHRELSAIAARAYGAPSAGHVVAAPGTQILLPLVHALRAPGRALVLAPTYAEHRRAAALCGHDAKEVADFDALAEADLAIVVNPNNPDGRVISRVSLLDLAARLRRRGGLLVVDEAFMDVGPRDESLCGDVGEGGILVLRSFGKFFGLAGVRLGFAVAASDVVKRLDDRLGPWSVAGPALEYGIRALGNAGWAEAMRTRLQADAAQLDALFCSYGLSVDGGTSLFRHITTPMAQPLFEVLGRQGILIRSFDGRPNVLRVGLPGSPDEWARLEAGLAGFSTSAGASR